MESDYLHLFQGNGMTSNVNRIKSLVVYFYFRFWIIFIPNNKSKIHNKK